MNTPRVTSGFTLAVALIMTGCVSSPRFTLASKPVSPGEQSWSLTEEGVASYYADEYNGRKTSNGETYDMNKMTAAHRTLPFNSMVKVTNQDNGKAITVRINDRGPFKDDRIIDLSLSGAKQLGIIGPGTARVRLEVIELGDTTARK